MTLQKLKEKVKQAGQIALDLNQLDNSHGEMSDPETIQKWLDGILKLQNDLSEIINKWPHKKYELAYKLMLPDLFTEEQVIIIKQEWDNSRSNIGELIRRKAQDWFKRKL